ncbi:unnamed protein product [Dovyalis caffra]|uniref:F-box domain-containing protein n=1 Tax=Dovyalis caffra TaxID=77055 RepID=A0AAV1RNB9_9ROSI|nr:unnamed protein product [Dovyalis caffra]
MDDLLTEILLRLPTAKSAIGSKLVSKRWCSLISSRYFVSQLITHHINGSYSGFPNPPSLFVNSNMYRELSSITGKKEDLIFTKSPLELLPEKRESVSIVASYNDLLLCSEMKEYNGTDVVVYDPFNNDQTIFIDGSELRLPNIGIGPSYVTSRCLGVSQGIFRLLSYIHGAAPDHLSVWEAKDYETKRLSLICKVCFNDMISEDSLASKFVNDGWLNAQALAFHPNNKDVVYLLLRNRIITWKIQTGELEVVGEISYRGGFSSYNSIFTIVLPWWPTPVSTAQMPISSV